MKVGEIEINDLVMVRFLEDPTGRSYPSRVEDRSEKKALLSWPTEGGIRIPVHKEDRVFVSFTRADAAYGLETKVQSAMPEPIPLIEILLDRPVSRIQRREFARVQALLPIEMVKSSPKDREEEDTAITYVQTNTLDVSGGGAAIQHKLILPLGTLYDIKLAIPGHPPPLTLLAKVVRSALTRDPRDEKIYRYGLMFVSPGEGLRARLVKYVFDVQRRSMNR